MIYISDTLEATIVTIIEIAPESTLPVEHRSPSPELAVPATGELFVIFEDSDVAEEDLQEESSQPDSEADTELGEEGGEDLEEGSSNRRWSVEDKENVAPLPGIPQNIPPTATEIEEARERVEYLATLTNAGPGLPDLNIQNPLNDLLMQADDDESSSCGQEDSQGNDSDNSTTTSEGSGNGE